MSDALAASVTDGEHRLLTGTSRSWMHIEAENAIVQAVQQIIGCGQAPVVPHRPP